MLGDQRIAAPGEAIPPPPLPREEQDKINAKYCRWLELDE
jgi:hypothetical protein